MYRELKKQVDDKKVIEDNIRTLESRIRYKIQKELGLHATSYQELKIECEPVFRDRFSAVFAKIEELDNDLQILKGELAIIDEFLKRIDKSIASMNDLEKSVFRCRYLWGLTVKQTAERLKYSEDRIKQITREIYQK